MTRGKDLEAEDVDDLTEELTGSGFEDSLRMHNRASNVDKRAYNGCQIHVIMGSPRHNGPGETDVRPAMALACRVTK